MRPVLLCAAALLIGLGAAQADVGAQALSLDDVLSRLDAYLVTHEERLSMAVAEEEYEQQFTYTVGRQSVTEKRVLRSEFLFLRRPQETLWLGVRDVTHVDNRPLADRPVRLENLLSGWEEGSAPELSRIAAANARYNLGDIPRTVNVPTQALALLHPRHRQRLTIRRSGEESMGNVRVWRLTFREIARPTVIRTLEGANQSASGTVWVVPEEGAVLRTVLELGGDITSSYIRTRITVDFEEDLGLGFRVPARMVELYRGRTTQIVATASYRNFRQFGTSARIAPR